MGVVGEVCYGRGVVIFIWELGEDFWNYDVGIEEWELSRWSGGLG